MPAYFLKHYRYFNQVPQEFLKNNKGEWIDTFGNKVVTPVNNPYYDEFKEKWNPIGLNDNPSLPRLVIPKMK